MGAAAGARATGAGRGASTGAFVAGSGKGCGAGASRAAHAVATKEQMSVRAKPDVRRALRGREDSVVTRRP
jgi:hypothetical protein